MKKKEKAKRWNFEREENEKNKKKKKKRRILTKGLLGKKRKCLLNCRRMAFLTFFKEKHPLRKTKRRGGVR